MAKQRRARRAPGTYTPEEYAYLLDHLEDALVPLLEGVLRRSSTRIGATATNPPHMRDGAGDVGAASTIRFTRTGKLRRTGMRLPRRRAEDDGPLRKLTRRLERVIVDSRRSGGIAKITVRGSKVTLEKGADPAVVPEVWNEEGVTNGFGRGITIPARPFLAPAVEAEEPQAREEAVGAVVNALRGVRRGLTSASEGT